MLRELMEKILQIAFRLLGQGLMGEIYLLVVLTAIVLTVLVVLMWIIFL